MSDASKKPSRQVKKVNTETDLTENVENINNQEVVIGPQPAPVEQIENEVPREIKAKVEEPKIIDLEQTVIDLENGPIDKKSLIDFLTDEIVIERFKNATSLNDMLKMRYEEHKETINELSKKYNLGKREQDLLFRYHMRNLATKEDVKKAVEKVIAEKFTADEEMENDQRIIYEEYRTENKKIINKILIDLAVTKATELGLISVKNVKSVLIVNETAKTADPSKPSISLNSEAISEETRTKIKTQQNSINDGKRSVTQINLPASGCSIWIRNANLIEIQSLFSSFTSIANKAETILTKYALLLKNSEELQKKTGIWRENVPDASGATEEELLEAVNLLIPETERRANYNREYHYPFFKAKLEFIYKLLHIFIDKEGNIFEKRKITFEEFYSQIYLMDINFIFSALQLSTFGEAISLLKVACENADECGHIESFHVPIEQVYISLTDDLSTENLQKLLTSTDTTKRAFDNCPVTKNVNTVYTLDKNDGLSVSRFTIHFPSILDVFNMMLNIIELSEEDDHDLQPLLGNVNFETFIRHTNLYQKDMSNDQKDDLIIDNGVSNELIIRALYINGIDIHVDPVTKAFIDTNNIKTFDKETKTWFAKPAATRISHSMNILQTLAGFSIDIASFIAKQTNFYHLMNYRYYNFIVQNLRCSKCNSPRTPFEADFDDIFFSAIQRVGI